MTHFNNVADPLSFISALGDVKLHPPATKEALDSLMATFGHPALSNLPSLLALTNGVEGTTGEDLLWTAERVVEDNLYFRNSSDFAELYMPFEGLVFIGNDGSGDQFFVRLSGNNEVFRWTHETDERTVYANDIIGYLEEFVTNEYDA